MPRSLTVTISALCVPGLISIGDLAVEPVERRGRAEDGIRHLHLERREQVVAVAAEDVVVLDLDLEVQVAVRAAGRADLALAGQLQAHAGVDAGRHVDRHRARGAHAALAGAGRARVRDDGAVAAAGAARARGHHVAEQGAHGALDLTGAVADVAGDGRGARRAAADPLQVSQSTAVSTSIVALGAEDDLVEVDLDAQQRVLPALACASAGRCVRRLRRPEEGLEDVAEAEAPARAPPPNPACGPRS